LLLAALHEGRLQVYGQKGIGKAMEYRDKWDYLPFELYISPDHETDHTLIPGEFWGSIFFSYFLLPQIFWLSINAHQSKSIERQDKKPQNPW